MCFSVTGGEQANMDLIYKIASDKTKVYISKSYDMMKDLTDTIAKQVCSTEGKQFKQ